MSQPQTTAATPSSQKTPEQRQVEMIDALHSVKASELDCPPSWDAALPALKPLLGLKLMLGTKEVDTVRMPTMQDDKAATDNRLTYKSGYFNSRQGERKVYRFIQLVKSSFIPQVVMLVGPWEITLEYNLKARIADGKGQVKSERITQTVKL